MKRLGAIFLCVLGVFQALSAQGPTLDWAVSTGGNGFDIGRAVALDAQGNACVAGFFQGTADFDPGPSTMSLTSNGDNDAFIQKLDVNGGLLWVRTLGGTMVDEAKGIAVDQVTGDVYVTGRFSGTIDSDPGPGIDSVASDGFADIFILKLTANGDFVWLHHIGTTGFDEGTALAADASGVYVTGYFQGTMDLDPGMGMTIVTSMAGTNDAFVEHLDSAGNFVWGKAFGADGTEYGFGINHGPSGSVFVTGCFQDTVDFDPGVGVATKIAAPGATACFVLALDGNGVFQWAVQNGTTGFHIGYAVATNAEGMVFVTGGCNGTLDLDPGTGTIMYTSNSFDVFIQKLDTFGLYHDAWAFGGLGDDYGYGISVPGDGGLYVTGGYGATVDFDPDPVDSMVVTSYGNSFDAFVEKLDTLGNFQWVVSNGGSGVEYGFGLAANAIGKVLTTGCFDFVVDFDPTADTVNLQTAGGADIYVQMLQQCSPNAATISEVGCSTVVVNNQVYSTSGTYQQVLTNLRGCDSLLTVVVTIAPLDTTVVVSFPVMIAQATGAIYQWYDCSNGFALVGDTNQVFYPQYNAQYAVIVTQNGCTDTSGCHYVIVDAIADALPYSVDIAPNPNKDGFRMVADGTKSFDIEIHDMFGRIVLQRSCANGVWVEHQLSDGLYIVTLRNEEGIRRLKMLVE